MPAFAADVPLDKYAIAHWMHEFGFDPNGLLHPPEPIEEKPAEKPKKTKPPKRAGFGSTLGVRLPEPASKPDLDRETPVPTPAIGPAAQPAEDEPLDPLLQEAFEEWFGSLHLDDLDMRKWVDGVEPL